MNLAPYRKLVAYAVVAGVVLIKRYAGIDLGGTEDLLVELVVLAAGGYAVYAAPNAPLPSRDPQS